MARTMRMVDAGIAPRFVAKSNVNKKVPAPKPASNASGLRHRKAKAAAAATAKLPGKCARPCCWRSATGVRCTCKKNVNGRCKQERRKQPAKGKKTVLEEVLVPGYFNPLYGPQTVSDGAAAQYNAGYGGLRRAGGGAQRPPQFVTLPPRSRKQTTAMLDSIAQRPKKRNTAQVPKTRGGRKVVAPKRLVAV